MIRLKEIYDKIIEQIEPSKYTLYCDMDGVLCDFEKRFKDLTGLLPSEYRDKFGSLPVKSLYLALKSTNTPSISL